MPKKLKGPLVSGEIRWEDLASHLQNKLDVLPIILIVSYEAGMVSVGERTLGERMKPLGGLKPVMSEFACSSLSMAHKKLIGNVGQWIQPCAKT